MSRDQRMRDNWALLYALEKAAERKAPCAVAFNLVRAPSCADSEPYLACMECLPIAAAGVQLFVLYSSASSAAAAV